MLANLRELIHIEAHRFGAGRCTNGQGPHQTASTARYEIQAVGDVSVGRAGRRRGPADAGTGSRCSLSQAATTLLSSMRPVGPLSSVRSRTDLHFAPADALCVAAVLLFGLFGGRFRLT